jgi:phosphatidylserine/phosphatidylglycerophosphate/cardiolipin synthase-like enzyme
VAESLVPLVDGRAAMLAMAAAYLTAKHSIWLADWDMHARLLMVRDSDQRAGPTDSPSQRALVERLRTAGLDDEAIALWDSGQLRVLDVLGYAAGHGVDVHVLLWDPFNPGGTFHMTNDVQENKRLLEARGVHVALDKNSRSLLHVAQALHQKCSVVDGQTAFVGGVDLTVQWKGDFDRWDTPAHPFDPHARRTDLGDSPHPWHDAHVLLTGVPALDVERNLRQRWHEAQWPTWRRISPPLLHLAIGRLQGIRHAGQHALRREERGELPQGAGPPIAGASARVQVIRTIPPLTYRFAPQGIFGIAQAYTLAVRRAERFIYLESQYLWLENFAGIDVFRLGWTSHHMRALLDELAAAAERGVTIALLLPDHPNAGRGFTDGTIEWLRQHAPTAIAQDRLHFFTLCACAPHPERDSIRYRPIYVHAKVGIVDDRWATVGSANLNSRGVSHDAELNLSVLDEDFARALRLSLWSEHAGALPHARAGWPAPAALPLPHPLVAHEVAGLVALAQHTDPWNVLLKRPDAEQDLMPLEDPLAGLKLLAQRARDNLTRLRSGQPLAGQLLPYLRSDEGSELGLQVDRERGLLDPLRAEREGVQVGHSGRYV